MKKKLFKKYESDQITNSILEEASRLFCENYEVWSEQIVQILDKSTKIINYESIIYLITSHIFMSKLSLTIILLITSLLVAELIKKNQFVESLS